MAKIKILSLKESFLELQGTVLNASLYFDAWWELKNAANPAHDAYQKSIDRYPLFFIAAADAQLLAVFVLLYQVYETRDDTQNLPALLRRLVSENPSSLELAAQLRASIEALHPTWQKVAKARCTVMAHLAQSAGSEGLMASVDITPNEIGEILSESRKLLEPLPKFFGVFGSKVLHPDVKADVRKLMKDWAKSVG